MIASVDSCYLICCQGRARLRLHDCMGDVSVPLGNGTVPCCVRACVQFYSLNTLLPA